MKFRVRPVSVEVEAPVGLLYQMLAAVDQSPAGPGERVEVRSSEPDRLVADFWTRVQLPLGRSVRVRTREAVDLRPPDRVGYRHLEGPLRGLVESITASAVPGRPRSSRLTYRAELAAVGPLRYPLLRLLGEPILRRTMTEHFADLKARAEARAHRSRVFAADRSDGGRPTA